MVWMLRARGVSALNGIQHLVNENNDYNVAKESIDVTITFDDYSGGLYLMFEHFMISRLNLLLNFRLITSLFLWKMYSIYSLMASVLNFSTFSNSFSTRPAWNLSHFLTDHFSHCRLVRVHQLVQLHHLFYYLLKILIVSFPPIIFPTNLSKIPW